MSTIRTPDSAALESRSAFHINTVFYLSKSNCIASTYRERLNLYCFSANADPAKTQ
jgi:hypothetical protein